VEEVELREKKVERVEGRMVFLVVERVEILAKNRTFLVTRSLELSFYDVHSYAFSVFLQIFSSFYEHFWLEFSSGAFCILNKATILCWYALIGYNGS
jgi:hypothetical protein